MATKIQAYQDMVTFALKTYLKQPLMKKVATTILGQASLLLHLGNAYKSCWANITYVCTQWVHMASNCNGSVSLAALVFSSSTRNFAYIIAEKICTFQSSTGKQALGFLLLNWLDINGTQ